VTPRDPTPLPPPGAACQHRLVLARLVLVVLGAGAITGCAVSTDLGSGSDGGLSNGSCIETVMTSGFVFRYCADYIGLTPDQVSAIRMVCSSGADAGTGVSATGAYSTGTCDRTGSLGGCMITSGAFSTTIWWWPSMGAMDVSMYQGQCTAEHGIWVSP
jgi:hypothetical protein